VRRLITLATSKYFDMFEVNAITEAEMFVGDAVNPGDVVVALRYRPVLMRGILYRPARARRYSGEAV